MKTKLDSRLFAHLCCLMFAFYQMSSFTVTGKYKWTGSSITLSSFQLLLSEWPKGKSKWVSVFSINDGEGLGFQVNLIPLQIHSFLPSETSEQKEGEVIHHLTAI
jgi:hypothetical protein